MTQVKNQQTKKRSHRLVIACLIVLAVILVACVAFGMYFYWSASHSLPQNDAAYEQLLNSQTLKVSEQSNYFQISTRASHNPSTGLIIYPGAFVQPGGYVASYALLASDTTDVFVLKSPLNFGLLNTNQAEEVIRANPSITHWFVAGHSLGGVAACEFSKRHGSQLSGLILLASYCNGSATNLAIPVLSISGAQDGLATPAKIDASKKDLPASTLYQQIPGQNHTLFGTFAHTQSGDNTATITQQESTQILVQNIQNFMQLHAQ